MLFWINFFSIINILFSISYLFLNDEFAIAVSLFIVFFYLLTVLRRFTLYNFFTLSDFIYFNFYILLFLNKTINIFLKNYLKNLYLNLNFLNINSFIILIKQLFFKKLININFLFFFNRVKNIFLFFTNVCNIINIIKKYLLLNNVSLYNNKLTLLSKSYIFYINYYYNLFQKSVNKKTFFYVS